jgi:hypothetical protein
LDAFRNFSYINIVLGLLVSAAKFSFLYKGGKQMNLAKGLIVGALALTTIACANRPESIAASHVAHEKYAGYDCVELATTLSDARETLHQFSEKQDSKANGDAVGVFLLAIPFSKLSGDYEGDVAKWKGEVEAIETAQVIQKCKAAPTGSTTAMR